jgi:hypothetical protein
MRISQLIVVFIGATENLSWELRTLVEMGRVNVLIVLFPETKFWLPAMHSRDTGIRLEKLFENFTNTPWAGPLRGLRDYSTLRAIVFTLNGGIVAIRSDTLSRTSYQLAAIVAHYVAINKDSAISQPTRNED